MRLHWAFVVLYTFFCHILSVSAQHTDCITAYPICDMETVNFSSNGAGIDDFANPNNDNGCLLFNEHESVWLVVQVDDLSPDNAMLAFTLTPQDSNSDFDFAIYGPVSTCDYLGEPIRCSYASAFEPNCTFCPQTGLGMGETDFTEGALGNSFLADLPVQANEIYYILVDNFQADVAGFELVWTGDAVLDCDFSCLTHTGSFAIPKIPSNASNNFPSTVDLSYMLCDGDQINISSDLNYALPEAHAGEMASLFWALYSAEPPTNPSLNDIDFTGILIDADNISDQNTAGLGSFSNSLQEIWFVPVVGDDGENGANGIAGIDSNNDNCFAYGKAVHVQYLSPIMYTIGTGCNGPVITASGGDFLHTPIGYTVSDLLPNYALPSNYNPIDGETFGITGLSIGDAYSFTLTNNYGCFVNISGVFDQQAPSPTAFAAVEGSLCEDEPYTLMGSTTTPGVAISYQWTSTTGYFSTEQNPTVTSGNPGNYILNVTVDGCTSQAATINVSLNDVPDIDPILAQITCDNEFDLSSLFLTGDNLNNANFNFYSNHNGDLGSSINPMVGVSGTYWIEAAIGNSPNSCTANQSVSVSLGDVQIAHAYLTAPPCGDSFGGTINTNIVGGTAPYSYNWSNSMTSEDIQNVQAADYSLTVTDANGCSVENTYSLSSNTYMQLTANQQVNPTCFNINDGFIHIGVTGGTNPYNYHWNVGGFSSNLNNLGAGVYSVTVTDASGCQESIENITLIAPNPITATTSSSPIDCGQANGTANIIAQGGTGTLAYTWSHDPTLNNPTALNLAAGAYFITVSDEDGCMEIFDISVSGLPAPSLNINNITPANCNRNNGTASVSISNANGNVFVQWSDPAETIGDTVDGLQAGTYFVTATDETGCAAVARVDIPSIAGPSLLIDSVQANSCLIANNGVVELSASGGVPPYTFIAADGTPLVSGTINNLSAGIYSYGVFDANDCFAYTTVDIPFSNNLELQIDALTPASCGNSDGSIRVFFLNAIAPINYNWIGFTNSNSPILNNLSAGNYVVEATDANGCSETLNFTIPNANGPLLTPQVTPPSGCVSNDGIIEIEVLFGNEPYDFTWSHDPVINQASVDKLPIGEYAITVTDALGCTNIVETELLFDHPNPPIVDTTLVIHTACFEPVGAIEVETSGGLSPYTYEWSNGALSQNIYTLAPNLYTVTVTDAAGCTNTTSQLIIDWDQFDEVIQFVDWAYPSCGQDNGWIQIYLPEGQSCYWENHPEFGNATTLTNLPPGEYTVVSISNIETCTPSKSFDLFEIPPPNLLLDSLSNNTCFSESYVAVNFQASAAGLHHYEWSHDPNLNSNQATGLPAGDYVVTAFDSLNCSAMVSFSILDDVNSPQVSLSMLTEPTCENSTGSITVMATGGVGELTYVWSHNPILNDPTVFNLFPGTYEVIVIDENACSDVLSISLTYNEPPSLELGTATEPNCGVSNGTINVSASGGSSPYTYAWSHNPLLNSPTANNISSGTYSVTVTDANNCIDSLLVALSDAEGSEVMVESIVQTGCANTGSITVSASGGAGGYQYSWTHDPLLNSPVADDLTGGFYAVVVTDVNGCEGSLTIELPILAVPDIMLSGLENTNCGENNGSISIALSNAIFPVSYQWSHDPTLDLPYASGLSQGEYTVSATNANGCSSAMSFDILSDGSPQISLVANTPIDCNNPTASLAVTVSEGQAPYSYQWSHNLGLNTSSVSNLAAGSYSLTVNDANDCPNTATFEVAAYTFPSVVLDSIKQDFCNAGIGRVHLSPIPAAHYRINCGQNPNPVQGPYGADFLTDAYFIDGTATGTYVSAVSNNRLASIEFYGQSRVDTNTFSYQFPLADGTYPVRLYFVEYNFDPANQSLTDVFMEGNQVLSNFSPAATYGVRVGGFEEFMVTVSGGRLELDLLGVNPSLAAIEILATNASSLNYTWSHDANINTPNIKNLNEGTYSLTVSDGINCSSVHEFNIQNDNYLYEITDIEYGYDDCEAGLGNVSVATEKVASWRINCGGPRYTTMDGRTFMADMFFTQGLTDGTNSPIANTDDDFIYQSNRQADIKYEIPLSNGCYNVVLHFSEHVTAAPLDEAQNVDIEDEIVLSNLSIKGTTGASNAAMTRQVQVDVADEFLSLHIYTVNFGASICAIEIFPATDLDYNYTWSHDAGLSSNFIENAPIGTYSLTVNTQYGCPRKVDVTIQEPYFPSLNVLDVQDSACDEATGSILVEALGNISVNGAFENGIDGFSSDYSYSGEQASPSTYTITNNPISFSSEFPTCTDHSSGQGWMMVVDGATAVNQAVYCETFDVEIGNTCVVSVWGTSLTIDNPASLQFSIDGVLVDSPLQLSTNNCEWQELSTSYIATSTQVEVCVLNLEINELGNAFALDDFSFLTHRYDISWSHDGNLIDPFVENLALGEYEIVATNEIGCEVDTTITIESSDFPSLSVQSIQASGCGDVALGAIQVSGSPVFRINCGGPSYTSPITGNVFDGDDNVVGGITSPNPNPIDNTEENELYQNNREGQSFYELPTDNGLYEVYLHFVEPVSMNRRFNVTVEGNQLLTNYNVYAAAGGLNQATTESVQVNVNDGNLTISLIDVVENSILSAIEVYALTEGENYTWNHDSSLTNTLSENISGGTYTINVVNDSGCSNSLAVSVPTPVAPVISLLGVVEPALCIGVLGSATLEADEADLVYTWSHNSSLDGPMAEDLTEGTYTIIASNANNCSDTLVIDINDLTIPTVNLDNLTGTTCNEDIGTIEISVSDGVGPYSYTWSHDSNVDTTYVENLAAGLYTVQVIDKNGCVGERAIPLELFGPELLVDHLNPTTCNTTNGSISLNEIGQSAAPVNYTWSHDSNITSATATNLAAGNYEIIATDANNCTDTITLLIPNSDGPQLSQLLTTDNENCSAANGSANLTATGNGLQYAWSHDGNLQSNSATGLAAGQYTVNITDENGCHNEVSFEIQDPSPIDLIVSNAQVDTCAVGDGNLTLVVSGGIEPLQYEWAHDNSLQSMVLENLTAGTYSLTLTNGNQCQDSISVTIDSTSPPTLTQSILEDEACSTQNASIELLVQSETGLVNYAWSHDTSLNTNSLSNLTSGNYTVSITDEWACQIVENFELINQTDTVYSTQTEVICEGESYDLSGLVLEVDTTLTQAYTSLNGCDSLHTFSLSVLETSLVEQMSYSCNQDEVGVFSDTLSNVNGCDSIVLSTVMILETDVVYLWESSCDPAAVGIDTLILTNLEGCDSIMITTTNLLEVDTIQLASASCNPDEVGVFTESFTNEVGCDSLIITTVSLLEPDTLLLSGVSCDPDEVGVFTETLTNEAGCDSLIITTVNQLMSDTTYINLETCTVNELTTNTTYFTNALGCDSLIIETLTPASGDSTVVVSETCFPEEEGFFLTDIWTNVNGCDSLIYSEVMPATYVLDVPTENFSVSMGENIVLDLQLNFEADSILWSPAENLSCNNCPSPTASISQTTAYEVWIQDENGCQTTTQFIVFVDQTTSVYIPSAFSPNDDGINESLQIFASEEITNVQEFKVFDRWGELLYAEANFPPNDAQYGWDGRFRGQPMGVNVYVWYAIIEYESGRTEVFKGDVTLLR